METARARLRRSLAERGMRHTFESALALCEDYMFDFVNRTDTVRVVQQRELAVKSKHAEGAQAYAPTRGRSFRKLMKRLDVSDDSVFIDFGSGKGKVLLLASGMGFRRVVGVEFSGTLCDCARWNICRFRRTASRGASIEVVCTDAAAFPIPDDSNVFFMFNPFGMPVMEAVTQNIKSSLDRRWRPVWLIYNHPVHVTLLKESLQFREVMEYTYGSQSFTVLSN